MFNRNVEKPRAIAGAVAADGGVRPIHVYDSALKGFYFRGSEAAAMALSRNPNVTAVYEATRMFTNGSGTQVPSGGFLPWNLDRIDQFQLPLNDSYSYYWSGQGVVVYVLDSGVNTSTRACSELNADIADVRVREHRNFVPG
jgi:subtilisin family serine protease